jgi:hypothetical protein
MLHIRIWGPEKKIPGTTPVYIVVITPVTLFGLLRVVPGELHRF